MIALKRRKIGTLEGATIFGTFAHHSPCILFLALKMLRYFRAGLKTRLFLWGLIPNKKIKEVQYMNYLEREEIKERMDAIVGLKGVQIGNTITYGTGEKARICRPNQDRI